MVVYQLLPWPAQSLLDALVVAVLWLLVCLQVFHGLSYERKPTCKIFTLGQSQLMFMNQVISQTVVGFSLRKGKVLSSSRNQGRLSDGNKSTQRKFKRSFLGILCIILFLSTLRYSYNFLNQVLLVE